MSFERPNIARMQGYTPGEQLDGDNIIKLNTNENPYPPAPEVAEAIADVQIESLRRYPPPTAQLFCEAAAALHEIDAKNIITTNGSDEFLRLVFTTFIDPGEKVITTKPSYSLYPVLADIQNCELLEIPLEDNWEMPADFIDQLNASGAKLCILVNPHAPTGKLLSADYIAQIADSFSGIVLVDEAYVDFIDPALAYNSVPMALARSNVLILRTLSKGYSLAGLRFGYGIGASNLINPMQFKTRDSYNTDLIAQQLATAAITAAPYAEESWNKVRASRKALTEQLTELGFNIVPSEANFLLCQVPQSQQAPALYQQLKDRNILVRYFDQDRLRDCLRITVGTEQENQALLTALKSLL